MRSYLNGNVSLVCNYVTDKTSQVSDYKTCNILDYYVSGVERPMSFGMSVNYIIGYNQDCFALTQSIVISLSKDSFRSSRSLNDMEQGVLYLTLLKSLSTTPKRKNRL